MKAITIAGRLGKDAETRHSVAVLRRLLTYDPIHGTLTWNAREASDMPSGKHGEAVRWNSRYAGKPAMTAATNSGYPSGAVHKKPYLAHIIAWAIHTGEWPSDEIDHINGDRSDYRIANLRSVTKQENAQNRALPSNNTSGVIGVSYHARDGLWVAHIGGKAIGYFKDREQAIEARDAAQRAAGYHQNHGRVQA